LNSTKQRSSFIQSPLSSSPPEYLIQANKGVVGGYPPKMGAIQRRKEQEFSIHHKEPLKLNYKSEHKLFGSSDILKIYLKTK